MKLFYTLFLSLIFIVGCNSAKKDNILDSADRTILIYMAADNNLYTNGYAENNLSAMKTAIKQGKTKNTNIIVYIDTPNEGELPKIFLLDGDSEKVLYTYGEEHNSASKEVMQSVIAKVLELTNTSKYSLVLWSHASAWIPQEISIRSSQNASVLYNNMEVQSDFFKYPATKSFGVANYDNKSSEIDIPELSEAIPDGIFDYILFDCCYMGSAEVVYNLRNKADYIIGSPTEIMAEGFPYNSALEYMSGQTPDLKRVCEEYFNYYDAQSGFSRSATIALYNTSMLEQLASTYNQLIKAHKYELSVSMSNNVQCFDRYYNHFIFDLRNYAEQFCTTDELATLDASLAKAVEVKYNTSSFLSFDITSFCGLSVYITGKLSGKYDYANTFHSNSLDWGLATSGN